MTSEGTSYYSCWLSISWLKRCSQQFWWFLFCSSMRCYFDTLWIYSLTLLWYFITLKKCQLQYLMWVFFLSCTVLLKGEYLEVKLHLMSQFSKSKIRTSLKRCKGCKKKNTALDSSLLILQCETASNVLTWMKNSLFVSGVARFISLLCDSK